MLELNKIYNMDCLEGLKQLEDNSIDLIVTDPPYGISIDKKFQTCANKKGKLAKKTDFGFSDWDSNIPSKEIFEEMMRVSKNQIIFGGNYFLEYLKNTSCFIIWDKNINGVFADCEIAWTSFNSPIRKFKWTWNGMIQEDMKNKEERLHPTQKPLRLIEWIIKNYSKKGDLILDCFIGSGTTALACKNLERNYIGFEISKEYCEIAKNRLKKINNKKIWEFTIN